MDHAAANSDSDFFRHVLDAMSEHIAVIDPDGAIRYVNHPWLTFCAANNGPDDIDWTRVNYLDVCARAEAAGDDYGRLAREGIEHLVGGTETEYALEYPCHSPDEQRWFMARMTLLEVSGCRYVVISHHDITQRRLVEERAEELARTDPLTGVANRKQLDEFLARECKRAMRNGNELSVLLLDIDLFKSFNDHYGHQAGDECLRRVAEALRSTHRRAGELVARYGGEEFLVIMGDASAAEAEAGARRTLEAVCELAIPHEHSDVAPVVTVSIGVATMAPDRAAAEAAIVSAADEALYVAKEGGRNRYCVAADAR